MRDWAPLDEGIRSLSSLSALGHRRTQREGGHLQTRKRALTRHWICWRCTLILDFPVSRAMRNKCCLHHPVPGVFSIAQSGQDILLVAFSSHGVTKLFVSRLPMTFTVPNPKVPSQHLKQHLTRFTDHALCKYLVSGHPWEPSFLLFLLTQASWSWSSHT